MKNILGAIWGILKTTFKISYFIPPFTILALLDWFGKLLRGIIQGKSSELKRNATHFGIAFFIMTTCYIAFPKNSFLNIGAQIVIHIFEFIFKH
ncbi:hypothetical protein KPA96_13960 [Burkholderia cenocepacia]|uniref:hypothetical protein n=1 Tax=Burkholderia cenocepacia TaxID=95486 RepID=UPI002856BB87|nr:hypothetical protein [Burkholderia cenocepacia]MCB4346869.1 hypothetical protein [Burkholderia vietnamiensis]MDR8076763.1 hypothetical protein [Burkholderia cenocepacia]